MASLWGPLCTLTQESLAHHSGAQEPPDQPQHSPVPDSIAKSPHQAILTDRVEELLQVYIHHVRVPVRNIPARPAQCLMGTPSGTKAVAVIRERRLVARL